MRKDYDSIFITKEQEAALETIKEQMLRREVHELQSSPTCFNCKHFRHYCSSVGITRKEVDETSVDLIFDMDMRHDGNCRRFPPSIKAEFDSRLYDFPSVDARMCCGEHNPVNDLEASQRAEDLIDDSEINSPYQMRGRGLDAFLWFTDTTEPCKLTVRNIFIESYEDEIE